MNARQKRFCEEYLKDLNGTQAAIRASYTAKNADVTACKLLGNAKVKERIEHLQAKRAALCELSAERIVRELQRIAFGDNRNLMEWGPNGVKVRAASELSDDEAAIVAEVSETVTKEGGSIKVKSHDKVKALELLGKHIAMFTDKIEHKDTTPTEVEEVVIPRRVKAEDANHADRPAG